MTNYDRERDRDDRLRGLERALEAREEALRRFRERLEDRLDRIDDLDGAFNLGDFGAREPEPPCASSA